MQMPPIIYGTAWKQERTEALVVQALRAGFRAIDTACQPKHYHEPGVGAALAACQREGIRREEVYLQTKFTSLSGHDPQRIPYDPSASLPEQVAQSFAASLRNLLTTVTPRAFIGLRNAALAYAPSATTHSGFAQCFKLETAQWSSSTASSSLVRNAGRCHGSMPARSLART